MLQANAQAATIAKQHTEEHVAVCLDAAQRSACVASGFFRVSADAFFKTTRGAPREAFPRQVWMAGLVSELGFPAPIVGAAIKRDKATVEHACRIIEAIRGGMEVDDLLDVLGESGVEEFLGGPDDVEEFIEACEPLIDDLFAAFALVAIRGRAYCKELERITRERQAALVR